MILYSALPMHGQTAEQATAILNRRTQEAARDVMTGPQWAGKTVVMVWEHHHIAERRLEREFPGEKVTLRQLLNLDGNKAVPDTSVPETWHGDNFDYFWIVDYAKGSSRPTRFQARKQVFAAPFDAVPSNDWGTPPSYPANSKCESEPLSPHRAISAFTRVFDALWRNAREKPCGTSACGQPRMSLRSSGLRIYLWHTGQKNVDRPVCTMRLIVPLQPGVGHFAPSRS